MSERIEDEQLAEIMARGLFIAGTWDHLTPGAQEYWLEHARKIVASVERAGWRFLPPVDGR